MNEEKYLTYQKFNNRAAAEELAQVFMENGIDAFVEDDELNFDVSFAYSELNREYNVKLKGRDFEKADQLIKKATPADEIDEDYYLYKFTTDELQELVSKADEWSLFDVELAKKLLKERGQEISDQQVDKLKAERLNDLAKPEKINPIFLIFGYIVSLFGGLLGIVIGWHIAYHKRTLPNGSQVYAYSSNQRDHGIWILVIGLVSFSLALGSIFFKA